MGQYKSSNVHAEPTATTISPMALFALRACLLGMVASTACAQSAPSPPSEFHLDSDHDGLSDELEQRLLIQFKPRFMIGQHDCSNVPAEFQTIDTPKVLAENGTIYGQAFPEKTRRDDDALVEIHYYHLWQKDCGGHGHPLDTEHVAVLVRASESHRGSATWKAMYWYAAAHEDTVCDVSQIARASTLNAEDHGATVWISPGKHASYLNEKLCRSGCGADRCRAMMPLANGKLINMGEANHPMNGSLFASSTAWPLQSKMTTTNFPAEPLARLKQLPVTDIGWFHAGRHPAQGIIAISSFTEDAIAGGGRNASSAMTVAGSSTNGALSKSTNATGKGLATGYRHTTEALGNSMLRVGRALHVTPPTL